MKTLLFLILFSTVGTSYAAVIKQNGGGSGSVNGTAITPLSVTVSGVTGYIIGASSITTTSGLFGGSLSISGSTLTATSNGAVSAGSQPYIRQAIPANTLTQGALSKVFMSAPAAGNTLGGLWGGAASSGTYTVAVAGRYTIRLQGYQSATGTWITEIRVNGSAATGSTCYDDYGAVSSVHSLKCSASLILAASDVIEVYINQPTATGARFGSGLSTDNFTMEKVW